MAALPGSPRASDASRGKSVEQWFSLEQSALGSQDTVLSPFVRQARYLSALSQNGEVLASELERLERELSELKVKSTKLLDPKPVQAAMDADFASGASEFSPSLHFVDSRDGPRVSDPNPMLGGPFPPPLPAANADASMFAFNVGRPSAASGVSAPTYRTPFGSGYVQTPAGQGGWAGEERVHVPPPVVTVTDGPRHSKSIHIHHTVHVEGEEEQGPPSRPRAPYVVETRRVPASPPRALEAPWHAAAPTAPSPAPWQTAPIAPSPATTTHTLARSEVTECSHDAMKQQALHELSVAGDGPVSACTLHMQCGECSKKMVFRGKVRVRHSKACSQAHHSHGKGEKSRIEHEHRSSRVEHRSAHVEHRSSHNEHRGRDEHRSSHVERRPSDEGYRDEERRSGGVALDSHPHGARRSSVISHRSEGSWEAYGRGEGGVSVGSVGVRGGAEGRECAALAASISADMRVLQQDMRRSLRKVYEVRDQSFEVAGSSSSGAWHTPAAQASPALSHSRRDSAHTYTPAPAPPPFPPSPLGGFGSTAPLPVTHKLPQPQPYAVTHTATQPPTYAHTYLGRRGSDAPSLTSVVSNVGSFELDGWSMRDELHLKRLDVLEEALRTPTHSPNFTSKPSDHRSLGSLDDWTGTARVKTSPQTRKLSKRSPRRLSGSPRRSPSRLSRSPKRLSRSPRRGAVSPRRLSVSRARSPRPSPRRSPRRSPTRSPHRSSTISPRRSPRRVSASPRRSPARSPRRVSMSPRRRSPSPRRATLSPRRVGGRSPSSRRVGGRSPSPRRVTKSPRRSLASPRRLSDSMHRLSQPAGRCSRSPTCGSPRSSPSLPPRTRNRSPSLSPTRRRW